MQMRCCDRLQHFLPWSGMARMFLLQPSTQSGIDNVRELLHTSVYRNKQMRFCGSHRKSSVVLLEEFKNDRPPFSVFSVKNGNSCSSEILLKFIDPVQLC